MYSAAIHIYSYTLRGKVQTTIYRQTSISSGCSLVPFGCYKFKVRVSAGFPEHLWPAKWLWAHSTPCPTPATQFSQLLVFPVNSSYQTTWLTTHKKCVKNLSNVLIRLHYWDLQKWLSALTTYTWHIWLQEIPDKPKLDIRKWKI